MSLKNEHGASGRQGYTKTGAVTRFIAHRENIEPEKVPQEGGDGDEDGHCRRANQQRFGAVAIDRDCRRQRDHADRRQIAHKGHRSCSNVDANAANDAAGETGVHARPYGICQKGQRQDLHDHQNGGESRGQNKGPRYDRGHVLGLAGCQFEGDENQAGSEQQRNEIRNNRSAHCDDRGAKCEESKKDGEGEGHGFIMFWEELKRA